MAERYELVLRCVAHRIQDCLQLCFKLAEIDLLDFSRFVDHFDLVKM